MKVDGRDVREYTLENLRSGVSMVLQNGSLFSGTIADNLRWADPNATREQMQAACAIARADEYIDRFPDGYDTVLEQNAANLSGGQRQRLLIARAILKRPKILILDDSTSAVDMATDEHIPPLSADGPARRHQGHHCPAHQLHHVLRPHCGAGPGASGGHGHPSGAAVPQPYLP